MKVSIEDLFYIYKSGGESVVALRGVHLEIQSGERLVIRGPNGSGKSTLVKILTGYYKPTAGKVFLENLDQGDIDQLDLRRNYIASVDQHDNLIESLTVAKNISLSFALKGASRIEADQSAQELLETHGLSDLGELHPHQISSGQKQMVSLLVALATDPAVLIADEPSGELDPISAQKIYELIAQIPKQTTVIMVTHDSRAEAIADRVIQLREGRISETWKPGEPEKGVVDPMGWMRVQEVSEPAPTRPEKKAAISEVSTLQADDIWLRYDKQQIFEGISFSATSGELIAVQGPSGAGRTSLLRILGGLQEPTMGKVQVDGIDIAPLTRDDRAVLRKRKIGFSSQGRSPWRNISLDDLLGEQVEELGRNFVERKRQPLASFSGGERARIELLNVLAQPRPILILDEPTSAMDQKRRNQANQLLFEYVGNGGLLIVSTRDEVLLNQADQVISLRNP